MASAPGNSPAPHTQQTNPSSSLETKSYTYYHAGPLFSIADLHTNTLLARAIAHHSHGRFVPILPQDLEQRGDVTPQGIRDKDLRALLSCDLALFTYDGAELDSGTVVEFMMAKFADVPAVILRSDFRGGGDQQQSSQQQQEDGKVADAGQPWNLMSSFWPRTEAVVVDAMLEYKRALASFPPSASPSGNGNNSNPFLTNAPTAQAGELLLEKTALKCIAAMEQALRAPSRMPRELRENVYRWMALMPGYAEGEDGRDVGDMLRLLAAKEGKGMFG
ncbi:hypothetical protein KC332_g10398 [Hortaea werneckii]|uniref:Nucleoside 2-deoxyribosyltransferase n=2 Tax=Hortaea werneckii TaxID=91943 RepID=A0A3M7IRF4_HORWE|nr:hypothetical protein KC358_g10335 [Hortaea werneckii]OTA31050.1 hypothetical protein BTJ68_09039 [Hortaea werneckii EXF-2000]KAI6821719.1 hypothetical protein KC350_g9529 [Hortaea werneckii]KAI6919760.1 hypothetical protein KC348_g10559 [Hortaea werneckii]KAI6930503.1 hypothetical protein KC341_g10179 [Hortaea werneckii]